MCTSWDLFSFCWRHLLILFLDFEHFGSQIYAMWKYEIFVYLIFEEISLLLQPCQPCQPIEVVLLALFKFWSNQVLGNAKNQVLCCWELIVQTVIFYFFSGVCLDGWYPYFSFRNYAPSLKVLVKQHDHFCIIVVDLMDGIHWHTLIVFVCLFFSFFFLIEKAHTTFPFIFFIGKPNTQTNPDCWNKP